MKRKLPSRKKSVTKRKAPSQKPIDLSDLPEIQFTNRARRGLFYRARKASITIRIDQDVLDYYKAQAADGRYQTEINSVLRQHMSEQNV